VVVIAIAAALAPNLFPSGDRIGWEGRSIAAGVDLDTITLLLGMMIVVARSTRFSVSTSLPPWVAFISIRFSCSAP